MGYADAPGLKRIKNHPAITAAYPAPLLQHIPPVRVASAKLSEKHTWGLRRLRIAKLWKQGLTGKGVVVGHLDTGVDSSHPALKERVEEFAEWDFLGRRKSKASPHDSADHGTGVQLIYEEEGGEALGILRANRAQDRSSADAGDE